MGICYSLNRPFMAGLFLQFDYNDWISTQCGSPKTEEWRKKMYYATSLNRKARPETYRDEWEDDDLVFEAYQDFAKKISSKHMS